MKLRLLTALQLFVGVAAVAGGTLLAAAPDGHLIAADPAVLRNSPFNDYLVPGLLLAVVVGGGGLGAALFMERGWPLAWAAAAVYAAGLVGFEVTEFALIGW